MDISKWLDEVAATQALQSLPSKQGDNPVSKKRARKQDESDSSLLALQSQSQRPLSAEPKALVGQGANQNADSGASHCIPNGSSRSGSSSHHYARRPRRKTRPDRYEPSSKRNKGRGKHIHQRSRDESKAPKRRTKRKHGEKPGSGIGQSFQANNVTGDRLTVGSVMQ